MNTNELTEAAPAKRMLFGYLEADDNASFPTP